MRISWQIPKTNISANTFRSGPVEQARYIKLSLLLRGTQRRHTLNQVVKAGLSLLRVSRHFFKLLPGIGLSGFYAISLYKRIKLGEAEPEFSGRSEEQIFVQGAVQHQRGCHVPVSNNLTEPCVLRLTEIAGDRNDVVRALRPELTVEPAPGLAHCRLAAEVIELKDDLSISSSGLFGHGKPPRD